MMPQKSHDHQPEGDGSLQSSLLGAEHVASAQAESAVSGAQVLTTEVRGLAQVAGI